MHHLFRVMRRWKYVLILCSFMLLLNVFISRKTPESYRYGTFHRAGSISLLKGNNGAGSVNNYISQDNYKQHQSNTQRWYNEDYNDQLMIHNKEKQESNNNNSKPFKYVNLSGSTKDADQAIGQKVQKADSEQNDSIAKEMHASVYGISEWNKEEGRIKTSSFKRNECSLVDGTSNSYSFVAQLGRKLHQGEVVKDKEFLVYEPGEIDKAVPFLKEFQNPCFAQELSSVNPYTGVVHDRRLSAEDVNCAKQLYRARIENHHEYLRMRCLPHFFLAGVQKCGTNEMLNVLPLHPQIPDLSLKENHWWNRGRFGYGGKRHAITMEGYLDLFNVPAEKILQAKHLQSNSSHIGTHITGDLSPALLWDQGFWRNMPENKGLEEPEILVSQLIAKVIPMAKFLIILRNPTDRLYSDWLFFASKSQKESNSTGNFHKEVVNAVQWMNTCIDKKPVRACFYDSLTDDPYKADLNRGRNPWWNPVFRLRMGMYYIFIKDLLDTFPRDQVMIFRLEDYSRDRELWLSKVYNFLGLDPYPELNEAIHQTAVHNKNTKGYKKHGSMLPETRTILDSFYKSYNNQLAELLRDENYKYSNMDTEVKN